MFNFSIRKAKKFFSIIILDGWGIAPPWGGNAISSAAIPNFNELFNKCPSTKLGASDGFVGLPEGSPGNSEAGHLNIGAGQIVHQDQPLIDEQIKNNSFYSNEVLLGAIEHARKNNSNLHLMGLLSKTGTHSHIDHLFALLKLCKTQNFSKVYIHLFTDGRDSDAMSGIEMANEVENQIVAIGVGRIATIIGRYFAMDRDNHWDRILKTYNLLVGGAGKKYEIPGAVFTASYVTGVTDEFIEPSIIANKQSVPVFISDNDSVIFFNFRGDRARQLTEVFLDDRSTSIPPHRLLQNLYYASFVMHDEKQLSRPVFRPERVINPLAQVWSEKKFNQYHIAETEKYAHVTYFINGGREEPFPGEDRSMIASPNVRTYDMMPEMSAVEVTDTLLSAVSKSFYDGFIVNFANPDMVGHTGNLEATIKAVEVVDKCLGRVVTEFRKHDSLTFVLADHGNAEQMVNPRTGQPDTEHTTNPVPFIVVGNDPTLSDIKLSSDGVLANVAPTMIDLMGEDSSKFFKAPSLIIK